jgi:hypothetical protein
MLLISSTFTASEDEETPNEQFVSAPSQSGQEETSARD